MQGEEAPMAGFTRTREEAAAFMDRIPEAAKAQGL
jgi:hypothetical protein